MTYSEKLKDPRWQRRRLEKMKQADFACEVCADSTEELHVHHKQYLNGYEPWEYEDSLLLCLCRTCHDIMHMDQAKVKKHAERLAVETKLVRYYERVVPRWASQSLIWDRIDSLAKGEFCQLRADAMLAVQQLRKDLSGRADFILANWMKRKEANHA